MKNLFKLTTLLIALTLSTSLMAQMTLEFNTNLSDGTTITLPLRGTLTAVYIDWGDGAGPQGPYTTAQDYENTYSSEGTYTVSITGTLTQFGKGNSAYTNADKLVNVTSFGSIGLISLTGAFYETTNLSQVPTTLPATITSLSFSFRNTGKATITGLNSWDVSNVTSMYGMFYDAAAFNQDLSSWNVGNVTTMNSMFYNAPAFNQNIGGWNVSNVTNMAKMFFGTDAFDGNIGGWERTGSSLAKVTDMSFMFKEASSFNQDIGGWNVSNVEDMNDMFYSAFAFNQDISGWVVSKVTDMYSMFRYARVFNQPLNSWDVSKVTSMGYMFNEAWAFNQPLNNWEVGAVTHWSGLSGMFRNANAFNQDISDWDVSNIDNMSYMFYSADIFNQDISGWTVSSVTNMSHMFDKAKAFNQDISEWDVSAVTNMSYMFFDADAFNQDISDWTVSIVENMSDMFSYSAVFNKPLNGWNVSSVTNMARMFKNTPNFDQDLSSWNVSNVTDMTEMFDGITLSTANYDALLIGWAGQSVQNAVTFSGGSSMYSTGRATTARDFLDPPLKASRAFDWTITDGGQVTDYIWDGSESSTWSTAGNWSLDAAPSSSQNAIIPDVGANYYPVIAIADEVSVYSLNVESGSSMTISSTDGGTGSLIVNGTSTGDVTMERYIAGAEWGTWNDGWHQISSPVAEQAIAAGNFSTGTYDFYCWYELLNIWVNSKNTTTAPVWSTGNTINNGLTENTANFARGKGYLVAYDETGTTKEFTGQLNTRDISISGLTLSGSVNYFTWHLLGNPYSSALTWDATAAWDKTNIGGTAQIWNRSGKSYSAITSGNVIPATNGFMVEVSLAPGSLTIPASKRVHSSQAFYKNTEYPYVKLKANNLDIPSFQESQLLFNPESTTGYEREFDGHFLAGYAPLFYSLIDDQPISVNSMPDLKGTTAVPFTFIKNDGLNFSIEMYEVENMEMDVWLLDKKLNNNHNLSQNPLYLFTAFEQDDHERFVIQFAPVGIEEEISSQSNIQVWASNKTIHILNPENQIGEVRILNLFGQQVAQAKLTGDTNQQIHLNVPTGCYLVNVVSEEGVVTRKVVVN